MEPPLYNKANVFKLLKGGGGKKQRAVRTTKRVENRPTKKLKEEVK